MLKLMNERNRLFNDTPNTFYLRLFGFSKIWIRTSPWTVLSELAAIDLLIPIDTIAFVEHRHETRMHK